MRFICELDIDFGGVEDSVLDGPSDFVGVAVTVFSNKVEGIAAEGAFQLLASKDSGELASLLVELEGKEDGSSKIVG